MFECSVGGVGQFWIQTSPKWLILVHILQKRVDYHTYEVIHFRQQDQLDNISLQHYLGTT